MTLDIILSLNQAVARSDIQLLCGDRVVAYGTPVGGGRLFVTMCAPYVPVTGYVEPSRVAEWVLDQQAQEYNDAFGSLPCDDLWIRADGGPVV